MKVRCQSKDALTMLSAHYSIMYKESCSERWWSVQVDRTQQNQNWVGFMKEPVLFLPHHEGKCVCGEPANL